MTVTQLPAIDEENAERIFEIHGISLNPSRKRPVLKEGEPDYAKMIRPHCRLKGMSMVSVERLHLVANELDRLRLSIDEHYHAFLVEKDLIDEFNVWKADKPFRGR